MKAIKHEDERRILTEWISNIPVKRVKIIEVKGRSVLGNHYHNNSDSVFYIYKGRASYELRPVRSSTAPITRGWLFEGESLFVPRGIIHTFTLLKDSVMMEAATEPYDKTDEIQNPF